MTGSVDWQQEAYTILRTQLARKDVGFTELARRLEAIDVKESARVLANKVGRGSFSFAFFLQCMYVLDNDVVRLWDRELPKTEPIGHRAPANDKAPEPRKRDDSKTKGP